MNRYRDRMRRGVFTRPYVAPPPPDPDATPDVFTFDAVDEAALSTVYESNTITVTGIDVTADVTAAGLEYSKNGGGWTAAAGTANVGDTFEVRRESAAGPATPASGVLSIGGVSATFTITTAASPALTLTPSSVPAAGAVDSLYTATWAISGGTAPYSLGGGPTLQTPGLASGVLTPGMHASIAGSTLTVSGYPERQINTQDAVITVADAAAGSASTAAFDITVSPNTVNGYAMDAAIVSGLLNGYTPRWGDDFELVRLNSPANPYERHIPNRTYLGLPRGGLPRTTLDKQHNVDPFYTGAGDSGRGEPIAGFANSIYLQAASVVRLYTGPPANLSDKRYFEGNQRKFVAAALSLLSAVGYYPGASGTGDVWVVFRVRFSAAANNPAGWHPTLWSQSCTPGRSFDSNEVDVYEGRHDYGLANCNNWDAAGRRSGTHTGSVHMNFMDDTFRDVAVKLSSTGTGVAIYVDQLATALGSAVAADSFNPTGGGTNSKGKLQAPLITNHIWNDSYSGTYDGEAYSEAAWLASAGAYVDVDSVFIATRTGKTHFRPKTVLPPRAFDFNSGSHDVTLPAAADLWSSAPSTEYVQIVQMEDVEPGSVYANTDPPVLWSAATNYALGGTASVAAGDTVQIWTSLQAANLNHAPASSPTWWTLSETIYLRFPQGTSYNAGTRKLTVDTSLFTTAGRLLCLVHAHDGDGTSCEPAMFPIYIGPKLNFPNTTWANGQAVSVDLYPYADCGALVTDRNGQRAKTITVSGHVALGLAYDPATFILSGTITAANGAHDLDITVTNSVGQSKTTTVTITVGAVADYKKVTSGLVGWYRADHADLDGTGAPVLLRNKAAGHSNLRVSTKGSNEKTPGTGTLTIAAAAQNGRNVLAITRDATTPVRASARPGDPVSQVFQGNDQPFSVAFSFKPNDSNTGWVFSASDTESSTSGVHMGFDRRNGSSPAQSLISRQASGTTATTVQAGLYVSGTPYTVLIVYSGTTVTVYRNGAVVSTANGAALDTAALSEEVAFYLGTREGPNADDPAYSGAFAMNLHEIMVWNRELSAGEITTLNSAVDGVGMRGEWAA